MFLAIASDRQAQPSRKRIDTRHANPVQATGNLVGILIELATGVQHAHHDLGCRPLRFMLVVEFDASRNSATVVTDRYRTVGMNGNHDVVTVTSQGLIDGVIDHFEDHVVQAGAVRRITDIHPRAFANRLETLELLNARFVVGELLVLFNHSESSIAAVEPLLPPCPCCGCTQMRMGMTTYLKRSLPGIVSKALVLASLKPHSMVSSEVLFKTSSRYETLKPTSSASPW